MTVVDREERSTQDLISSAILKCEECGKAYQNLDPTIPGDRLYCTNSSVRSDQECGALLKCHDSDEVGLEICRSLTIASLIMILPALLLPMMEISQIGVKPVEKSIFLGVWMMLSSGDFVQLVIGLVIAAFSILFPIAKLRWLEKRTRKSTRLSLIESVRSHRGVKKSSRWSFLDVVVIGVLVPFLQLGRLVNVSAGAGAAFFIAMALCSSLAIKRYNALAVNQNHREESHD